MIVSAETLKKTDLKTSLHSLRAHIRIEYLYFKISLTNIIKKAANAHER